MTYEEQIDEIMDWFDFNRVAQTMKALDWRWFDVGVPDEPELRKKARSLLKEVAKNGGYLQTAGFHAQNNEGRLKIMFVVSEWRVEGEEK